MPLPKIDQPLFDVTIPSSKKKILFRPFLVKEEKILLISQQGGEDTDVIRAIKQILRLCVQDEDFDVDKLTTFDLEYLFLKQTDVITSCVEFDKDCSISKASSVFFGLPKALLLCQTMVSLVMRISLACNSPSKALAFNSAR